MADQTIDKVQLELKATSQGATEVISGLVTQLNALKSVLSSLDTSKLKTATQGATKVGIDTSGVTKSEKEIMNSVDKIKKAFAGMTAYKDAGLLGDKSSLVSAQRRLVALQSMADVLGEQLRQAGDKRLGVNIDTDQMQAFRTELADLEEAIKEAKGEVDSAVNAMNGKKINVNTDESKSALSSLGDTAKKVAGELIMLFGKTMFNGFKNLKSGIGKIKSTLSEIGGRLSKFANTGFMKILRYGFGIRSLYVLFRRLKEAIKDSFGALQSSGAMFETTRANIAALKNALLTLKFQFGAAFEPIFNAIAPALQTLINYLVTVMNVISAFTAKLMGRSTYSKVSAVLTKTGSAAGGAAKNVKELNHQLQGFDELNNLTLDPGNSGGGGGGGGGGADGAMYEPASVDEALGDFAKELAKKIEEGDWFGLGRTISDKLSEVLESIPWDSIYEKARNFGTGLAQFLNGLITPRLFGDVAATLASALNTAFYFLNSFGKEFDWENFGNSIAAAINDFFETADFAEWGDTVHTYVAGILDAGIELLKSTDFEQIGEKIADFLNNLQIGDLAKKLGTFALTLAGAIAEALTSLWSNSSIQTKIGTAIVGLIAVGKLTGLSTMLASQIGSFLLSNPVLVGEAAIVVTAAIVGWKIGGKLYESATGYEGASQGFFATMEDLWDGLFSENKIEFDLSDFIDFTISDVNNGTGWLKNTQFWKDLTKVRDSIKTAWAMLTGQETVTQGFNGAPSEAVEYIYKTGQGGDLDNYWTKLGDNIVTGIAKGIKLSLATNPFTAPIVAVYDAIKKAICDKFGIHSPARAMFTYGESILQGIVKGFRDAIKKYVPDALIELYEYFNGGGTTTEKQGYTAPGNFKNGSSKTHNKTGQKVTINTQYTGDIKGKNGLKDAVAYWTQLMDGITDKDIKYQTSMLGAFTSVETVKEGSDNFKSFNDNFRNKTATYTTSMGGQIKNKEDLGIVQGLYNKLYNTWISKSSTMSVNTGGQISSINNLDTWNTKYTNLKNVWTNKSATMSVTVGGQMSNINNTDTWLSKIRNLYNGWVGRTANYNAGFNQSQGTLQGYTNIIANLRNNWYGSNATFTASASVNQDSINRTRSYIVDKLGAPINVKFVGKKRGGIFAGGNWSNIPQFASGTTDALSHGSLFVAGERGSEIVGNINGRTEVLNRSQIAATIKAATVSGMRLFRGSQMVRPPELDSQSASMSAYGYEMKSQMVANNEAIMEQNRLLQEQNSLLRQIADKDLTVSSKDVFNATRTEASNYYNRTGNSPFLY